MRLIVPVFLVFVSLSAHAQAPLPSSPQQVPAHCQQREARPTALLVAARDELKTPRAEFIDAVESSNVGSVSKQQMIERINDVYDNPGLNSDSLWVFRSARCVEEFARRKLVSYKPAINAALLECQTRNPGSISALAQCAAQASDANIIE